MEDFSAIGAVAQATILGQAVETVEAGRVVVEVATAEEEEEEEEEDQADLARDCNLFQMRACTIGEY